jgi:hypothetical protein
MTQRSPYRFTLMPTGIENRFPGQPLFKFVRVQIPGSDFPRSSKTRKQNQVLETENTVRHIQSGNGNSIFSPKEVSL